MAGTLTVQNLQGPSSGANANKIIIPSGQTIDASAGTLVPSAGSVVAVHKAFSNTDQTITSTTLVNITGLSITMTPKNANNLIVLQSVVTANCVHVLGLTFLKDGAKTTTTSGTNNNETDVHSTMYMGATDYIMSNPLLHYETAGSTSARTYTVAATAGWSGTVYTQRINDRPSNDMASTSWFVLWEIAQ